ncbi:MAG: acyltransferase, partial [Muribaculaceae bacterium]|nr:acyltransferase [Muribaculaceae bacterium]
MTREELQSNTISYLRFPLAVGVVMIHSWCGIPAVSYKHIPNPDMPIFSYIAYFCSVILPRIAVPLFFAIAGYLFFKKVNSFTFATYINKLKKRFKTLFIPYLFWNLLVILLIFLIQSFTTYYHDAPLVKDYSFGDWLWAIFYYNNIGTDGTNLVFTSQPAAYQLWFIRDLMIIMLFTPLIYVLCKRLKLFFILPLATLWLNEFWYLGFNVRDYIDRNVLFFFPLGAYFGIHKIDFIAVAKRWGKLAIALYAVLAVLVLMFENEWLRGFPDRILIVVGIVAAIYV